MTAIFKEAAIAVALLTITWAALVAIELVRIFAGVRP